MDIVYFGKHSEAKKKNPPTYRFRVLTCQEAKALGSGSRVWVEMNDRTLAEVRVTSVQTWKTRPGNVDVHVKYGLRDFAVYYVRNEQWSRYPIYMEVQG